jgi:hypothetical protein
MEGIAPVRVIRGIVLFQVGDPFGRCLTLRPPRPGLYCQEDAEQFGELERVIRDIRDRLAGCAPSEWADMAKSAPVPRVHGRKVRVRMLCASTGPASSISLVVIRALLPFQLWPVGGQVVFAGWNRSDENVWTSLSEDQLAEHW